MRAVIADRCHAPSLIAAAMSFVQWMARRPNTTAQDVVRRYDVSRATAYRWLRDYRDAVADNANN